jgi:hypothetical protein
VQFFADLRALPVVVFDSDQGGVPEPVDLLGQHPRVDAVRAVGEGVIGGLLERCEGVDALLGPGRGGVQFDGRRPVPESDGHSTDCG